jgi:phosphomannomutase
VAGYEANGGFLLGFRATGPAGDLPPLMTRDSFLPIIATLAAAHGAPLSARVAQEPPCFTAADRLQDVDVAAMRAVMAAMTSDRAIRTAFLAAFGTTEKDLDLTDGLRMTTTDGRTLHIRPSGNAPELRFYVEQTTPDGAEATLRQGLAVLREHLAQG